MQRRKTAYAALAAITLSALAYGSSIFASKPITPANKYLREFPAHLPAARSIIKYETPGAQTTLVHIRQAHHVHFNPDIGFITIATTTEQANATLCQIDIATILTATHADHVYAEGVTPNVLRKFNQQPPLLRALSSYESNRTKELEESLRELYIKRNGIAWELPPGQDLGSYHASLDAQIQSQTTELVRIMQANHYGGDAALKLAYERKITLRAPELTEVMEAGLREVKRQGIGTAATDNREDTILQVIALDKTPIAYLVLGAAHAFGGKDSFGGTYSLEGRISERDNIAEWNRTHPGQAFSLIEITPEHCGQK